MTSKKDEDGGVIELRTPVALDGTTRFLSNDAGLVILDATPEDAGDYVCHAENRFGEVEAQGFVVG